MDIKVFACESSDLYPGINLIEASAGTGKTYAIAMLALRFIVEQNLGIEQLLIVTFTNAATDELKDRIRIRLNEARQALKQNNSDLDDNIIQWATNLQIDSDLANRRLQLALLNIDQAGIFTIHGFCQRVLHEHALESGQLFDSELSGDISAIRQQLADDFWRTHVYSSSTRTAAILTAQYPTPDTLLASVGNINPEDSIYPSLVTLQELLENLDNVIEAAKAPLENNAATLIGAFPESKFKPHFTRDFEDRHQHLKQWLAGQTSLMPNAETLAIYTTDGLIDALNGVKFRANKSQTGDERKSEYLQTLSATTEPFNQLTENINEITLAFRRTLVETLNTALTKRLQQLNILSFDDLISRLSEILKGEKGELLKTELQQRFKVALLDEFQDTDNKQWFIFSRLFTTPDHFLFLIGDPKQAIYKFRGADIYSYFAAQQQAQYHYTLDKNWRSQPLLVKAVNTLFTECPVPQPFLYEQLQFNPVQAALTEKQGTLVQNNLPLAPMVLMQLQENVSTTGYWSTRSTEPEIEIRTAVVNEILQLLNQDQQTIKRTEKQQKQACLQAEDIAILVRSNKQACAYQEALHAAQIPSVLNSNQSVFASPEAISLYDLLQAIAHPGDIKLLKQALTLSWFNLDGQALFQTINDELAIDHWMTRFQNYFQYWQNKGLMAMMLKLLAAENIQLNLSQMINAERQLTNLHHLLELLQQASVDEHLGINKTLGWLQVALTDPGSSDERQLRLESDAAAVRIITMHRAKGLEFPVVFCPYLWHWNSKLKSEQELIKCHDSEHNNMLADLGSEQFEQHREQALHEQLAEDLRVLYVAVTRAKYRCYITWADVRTANETNKSALSYLLFGHQDIDFGQQQNHFTELCSQYPDVFTYQLLQTSTEINGQLETPTFQQTFSAQQRQRRLTSNWQMSSYTSLSALSQHDDPELPIDKAQEPHIPDLDQQLPEAIPRGAHTGNVLHELLEKISFSALANKEEISTMRDSACQRFGLHLEQPELLDKLLQNVARTPLSLQDESFILANLNPQECLKEMPFYLSMDKINTAQVNSILADSQTFQPLTDKQMRGYLTGFIDLICSYQDRYYIIDYKSNGLPDYQTSTLTHAMREHNYGLQYWIYTLVLHRYLQTRLVGYNYAKHFGGVRYLFIRGMQPKLAMSGVYQDLPNIDRIEQLSTLFGGQS